MVMIEMENIKKFLDVFPPKSTEIPVKIPVNAMGNKVLMEFLVRKL